MPLLIGCHCLRFRIAVVLFAGSVLVRWMKMVEGLDRDRGRLRRRRRRAGGSWPENEQTMTFFVISFGFGEEKLIEGKAGGFKTRL